MSKKYQHIKLPRSFIGSESFRAATTHPYFPDLPVVDYIAQKPRIEVGLRQVRDKFQNKQSQSPIPADREIGELKIKFYGMPDKKMLGKYGIEIYKYQKDQNAIIGKVSVERHIGQRKSDFERLEDDISRYVETGSLKSYFSGIEDIEPLTLEEILEENLKRFYEENPAENRIVDISFSSSKPDLIENKLDILAEEFSGKFLSRVNTTLVHFCRILLSYTEIQQISERFNEVVDISSAPIYFFETSSSSPLSESVTVTSPREDTNPVFIIDTQCNGEHRVVNGAILESKMWEPHNNHFHWTAVASLVICGAELNPGDVIIQKNTAITIEADFNKLEETIWETVMTYKDRYPMLLINLSINQYGNQFYDTSKRSNLTVLLDQLAHEYNCLFFISTGNFFQHFPDPTWSSLARSAGYPNYFNLPFAGILPPADSINNISVWSIAYQASPRSIAPLGHPSPITRRNIDNPIFVKPDLVHYDWNCFFNAQNELKLEENWIFFADSSANNSLTRGCGTSFATPLVAHDAGILHRIYADYNSNSIKAILLHFTNEVLAEQIADEDLRAKLTWFWKTNLETAMYSLNHSSTIIVEDSIGLNQKKRIRIPIPLVLRGSSRKRLRLRKTLVCNPLVFPKDSENYNPIKLSACFIKPNNAEVGSYATRDRLSLAHKKSNVKKYDPIELSTNNDHVWNFWEVDIRCECKIEDFDMPTSYKQKYSLIVTIEDMFRDETINLHEEVCQMIEIDIPIEVDVLT